MLAAFVAITAHVDVSAVLVVVKVVPEITHPGLLVENVTSPEPVPPAIPSVKLELTRRDVEVLLTINGSWSTTWKVNTLAAELLTL